MPDRLSVDLLAHRAAVEAELQGRIAAHQRLVVSQGFLANRDPARPLNLLADGDSWFDYPLSGDFPIASDVIVQLGNLVAPRPFILNLGHHGDATTQMLGVPKRNRLLAALQDPKTARSMGFCSRAAATTWWAISSACGSTTPRPSGAIPRRR